MLDRKPESLEALIDGITPEIHGKLKTAVELGKWESGESLSAEQLAHCLQAIIAWEHRNLPLELRTGFLDPGGVSGSSCRSPQDAIVSDHGKSADSVSE